jgi:hypothetical protein
MIPNTGQKGAVNYLRCDIFDTIAVDVSLALPVDYGKQQQCSLFHAINRSGLQVNT